MGTTATKSIGTTGGTLGTTSGNASVNIPAGAVAGDTSLTVAVVAASQAPATSAVASKVASSVYDFSPNGTQFAVPVSMALKTTAAPAAGQKAVLAYLGSNSTWQVIPSSTYDASTSTVSAPVSHFTIFAVIIVAADGTGCSEQQDPNAYCAPLICSTAADKCAPIPSTYTLGGSVSGLSGTLTLSDPSAGLVTVAGNGNFVFPNALVDATVYAVQVSAQPAGQICTVTGGQGSITAANVGAIAVSCVSYYAVGGQVSGLLDGATVGLVNGNDTLVVAGNINFTFALSEAANSNYQVAVATQPNFQTCTVQNGNGTLTNANVTNVAVACVNNTFTVGGHISGLRSDARLALANGNDTLNANNGVYTFASPVLYGSNYNVTFTSPAGYSCAFATNVVGNGNITAPVTGVNIACTLLPYSVGGSVSGLVGGAQVTLSNGADTLYAANGPYVFSSQLDAEDPYDVSISSPVGEICVFDTNVVFQGQMPNANVTGINVVCTAQNFNLGVQVSGLVANGQVTVHNGNDSLQLSNGNSNFPTVVTFGSNYNVTFTAPNGQSCQLGNGAPAFGSMPAANVNNVLIACSPNTYNIQVAVTGLVNGAQVSLFSGANAPMVGNGNTIFASPVAYAGPYNVSLSPPPGETCAFGGGGNSASGTMAAAALSLNVTCTPVNYTISGGVTGLVASANVTLVNGNDTVRLYNGAYTFPTQVAFGSNYNATVAAPAGQTCGFTASANAVMAAGNVTLNVSCSPNLYPLGGSVAGLAGGANLTLTNNGNVVVTGNGNYTFGSPIAFNGAYAITLSTPAGHSCAFTGSGSGTMGVGGARVAVTCTPLHYAIGGTVSGLVTGNVTLTNGSDSVSPTNGSYMFQTSPVYGANYNATVASPAGQTCSYAGSANGIVGAANVTLNVNCAPRTYSLIASVSGLVSNTNVTLTNGSDTLLAPNGSKQFPTLVAYNSNYAIGITSPTAQTCAFATTGNGTVGAANVTVAISCVPNSYTILGSISGLINSTNVSIKNGSDNVTTSNGAFTLPTQVVYGANYNVTVTSPTGQTCMPKNPNGAMGNSNLTVTIACTTNTYTLYSSVSGIVGNNNVVLASTINADSINVGNGNTYFPTQIPYGANYGVTTSAVTGHTCTTAAATGTFSNANITLLTVCTPNPYAVSGSISGLLNNVTVNLQNGSDSISVTNGSFSMPLSVNYGSNYNITFAQPVGQTCSTTNGNGIMSNANVTNVTITCVTSRYTIRGTVTGLVASASVTLANGSDSLTQANGAYTFPTTVPFQGNYNIMLTPPNGQNCNVLAGEAYTGTMSVGDINVSFACQPNTYSLGGRVVGLVTSANVTMHNGSDSVPLNNGAYTFPTLVAFNSAYAVTVTSATGQSCSVSNANAVMGAGNVTNANVLCTPNSYSLIGHVSGLVAGQVTLANSSDSFSAGNGNTLFPTQVAYNTGYAVTATNPTGQQCVVAGGSGTMGGGNIYIGVTCSPNTYNVAGSVNGLVNNMNVVVNNGNNSVSLYNGAYTFPTQVAYQSTYAVTATSPAGQSCTLGGNANGTMGNGNVSGITVTCSQLSYHVQGVVSGLLNNGTVALTNGADTSIPESNGPYTLPTQVVYNASYSVSLASPTGQTCTNTTPLSGTMGAANANVNISCSPNPYQVGGQIVGLITNTNVSVYNGNDTVSSTNGNYVFPTPVNYFSNYNVTLAAPAGQLCFFNGGYSGVMGSQNITSVGITCEPATYSIGGSVSGLVSTGKVGITSGSDTLQIGNANFLLPTQIAYQATYGVNLSSPSGQSCTVSSGVANGTMGAGNVTLGVTCTPRTYAVGGRVSGLLANTNVTLYNGNDVVQSPNGVYTMPTAVAYFANYNVTLASPVGQTCSLNSNHAGVMPSKAVTNANVTCQTNTYTLSGVVSGLLNGASVTVNSGADAQPAANGNYSLPTPITYGQTYTVTLTAPSGQNCSITGGAPNTATMGAANIANLNIACHPYTYALGGYVSGMVNNANLTITSPNDTLSTYNGTYTMPQSVAFSSNYNYTVAPPAGQSCSYVTSGNSQLMASMPAASVHNANINCTPMPYTLGGAVSGLLPATTVTLTSGADTPAVGNASYTFNTQINYNNTYSVALTQPTGQNCSFVGNSNTGQMPASALGNVNVTCSPLSYTLGGSVSGLISNANITVTNGLDSVSLYNGAYTFPTSIAYTSPFNIGITSPAGQNCTFTGSGTGTMTAANITNRNITCSPIPYTLGGTVTGLLPNTSVTLYSGNDNQPAGNGNYTFPTQIAYATNYNVTLSNPVGHTCVFSNSNYTQMAAGGTSKVNVTCTVKTYAIGGTVSNLTGSVTVGNGNDSVILSSNAGYTMPLSVAYQGTYNVTVTSQPSTQICSVANSAGTVQAANITNINLSCTNAYTVGGAVTGLPVDTNVWLSSAITSDTINVRHSNGNFTMPQRIANLGNYNVVVASQPPGLVCTPSNNSGSLSGGNITNIAVSCALNLSFNEGQNATLVVGQSSFTASASGTSSTALSSPSGAVYMSADGNVYISDTGNKRVLGFAGRPRSNGQAAAFVVGQTDANTVIGWSPTTPRANTNAGQGASGNGNYVAFADSYSSRVLLYAANPNSNVNGVYALGQPDLVTGTPGCSAQKLNHPAGVWVNNSNYIVADTANHRVLIYLAEPTASGANANIVLGQPDMVTCTLAGSTAATNFASPQGVWTNGVKLAVADTSNNRVLVWNSFPSTNQQTPDVVFGQPDFVSTDTSDPTSTLNAPASIVSDGAAFYVAERFNSRVTGWGPLSAPVLEVALGQIDTSTNSVSCNNNNSAGVATLCQPAGVSIIGVSLYVTDYGNNRVVVYKSN